MIQKNTAGVSLVYGWQRQVDGLDVQEVEVWRRVVLKEKEPAGKLGSGSGGVGVEFVLLCLLPCQSLSFATVNLIYR